MFFNFKQNRFLYLHVWNHPFRHATISSACLIHFNMSNPFQHATISSACLIHFNMSHSFQHATISSACLIFFNMSHPFQHATISPESRKQSHIYINSSCSISSTYPHPLQHATSLLTYHIHLSVQHLNRIHIPLSIAREKLNLATWWCKPWTMDISNLDSNSSHSFKYRRSIKFGLQR